MSYFPFFMDVTGKSCVVAGGGEVARRKVEKLLPFGAEITVIAPEVCKELQEMENVLLICRGFEETDVEEADFVIAATDDRELNRRISQRCRERKIPVNVVDDPELCSFYFPALIQKGDLSIGISTSGASPLCAAYLREQIEQILPEQIETILEQMQDYRKRVKSIFPEPEQRAEALRHIFSALLAGKPEQAEQICSERGPSA